MKITCTAIALQTQNILWIEVISYGKVKFAFSLLKKDFIQVMGRVSILQLYLYAFPFHWGRIY